MEKKIFPHFLNNLYKVHFFCIGLLLLFFIQFSFGQKVTTKSDSIVCSCRNCHGVDSALLAIVLLNSTVNSYFQIQKNDTISIILNPFVVDIATADFSNVVNKKIIFVLKENARPRSLYQTANKTLEILAYRWDKNSVEIIIGKHNRYYVRLFLKKKNNKYIIRKSVIS